VPWRGTWAGEAGGAILGHAIHAHDLLCRYFGPVAQVQARLATRVNEIETEDCAAVSMGFRKRGAGDILGHAGRGAR
jgi:predicted dehydrogenase